MSRDCICIQIVSCFKGCCHGYAPHAFSSSHRGPHFREVILRLRFSLMIIRLGYCNSIFVGLPKCTLRPLPSTCLECGSATVSFSHTARRSCLPLLQQPDCLNTERWIEQTIGHVEGPQLPPPRLYLSAVFIDRMLAPVLRSSALPANHLLYL